MFKVNDFKEIKFSEATDDMQKALEHCLPGIQTCNIPFFWDNSGNSILINMDCKHYLIVKEIIDHITESTDLNEQMKKDLVFIKSDYKGNNLSALLALVEYLYSLEDLRRIYISSRKARAC